MNELTDSNLKRPLDKSLMGAEVQALNALVSFLNNPAVTGAVVEKEIADVANSPAVKPFVDNNFISSSPFQEGAPTAPPAAPPPNKQAAPLGRKLFLTGPPPTQPVPLGRKIFLTGRLCSGKDFVAGKIGAEIFGFADPIYALAEYLLDIKVNANDGKDQPGVRKFLQTVGQWGRNEVNEQYPHTVERAMFCMMVRSLANQNCLGADGVEWGQFGLSSDLWVDGLLKRVASVESNAVDIIAVTNCRFPNEYKRLSEAGYQHFHCACSPPTWLARLAEKKLDAKSPVVSDLSEKLASDLNADLTKKLSAAKQGPKMRVIWNDEKVPCPSNRIYTLEEFVQLAKL